MAAACLAHAQDTLQPPLLRRATIDLYTQQYRLDWDLPADTSRVAYYRIGRRTERATGGFVYAEDELIYAYKRETTYMRFPNYIGCCAKQVYAINSMPLHTGVDFPVWSDGYQTMYQWEANLDTCEQDYMLMWTPYYKINSYNLYPYANWEKELSYLIYVSEGADFDPSSMRLFANAGNVPLGTTSDNRIFRMKKVEGHHRYHFVIAAVYNDGRDTSYSNVQTLEYDFYMHPSIKLDSIVTSQNSINNVHFRIDLNTLYTDFVLERSQRSDTLFAPIAHFDKYARTAQDSAHGGRSWYYRVSVVKPCGAVIKSSEAVSSLLLNVTAREAQNVLRWNEIYSGNKSTSSFTLYRTSPTILHMATTADMWAIDYEAAIYSSKDYCYYVEGAAADSFMRQIAYVRSKTECYEAMTAWFMPDAVSPFSTQYNQTTGMRRNDFRPICGKKHKFILKIFNRWGSQVWQGENVGWDGQANSLKVEMPEGAYTYWIQIIFPNGRREERIGNVTVVWLE
jgi:hypothetical protein